MSRLKPTLRGLTLVAVLILPATALLPSADATSVIPADSPAAFESALDIATPGTVIRLANGTYPTLEVVGRSFDKPVHIVGSGSTSVGGFDVLRSRSAHGRSGAACRKRSGRFV